jgi:hypothetical protein
LVVAGEHAARSRKNRGRKWVSLDEFMCELLNVEKVITLDLSGSLPAMQDKIEAAGCEAEVKAGSGAVILAVHCKFVVGAQHLS